MLDARLRQNFLAQSDTVDSIGDKIAKERKTDRAYEIYNYKVGTAQAGVVGEGAIYPDQELKEGFGVTLAPVKVGFAINVSREAIQDNLFEPIAGDVGKAARRSMDQTREQSAVNLLNNGFATGTTPDGQYLFSASHVLKGGGTQANLTTASALDVDQYWAAVNLIRTTKGESTLFNQWSPDYIVVPQALERKAYEILRSDKVPFVMSNTANVAMQLYKTEVLTSPFLSSSTAWFLMAKPSTLLYPALAYVNREPLALISTFNVSGNTEVGDGTDRDTVGWKVRERYVHGLTHWFGTFGNAGA
jgi:phage major head subunit gpT-like protein